MPFTQNKHSGFTIVELLVVIVVIGILAALAVVAFNGVTGRARIAVVQSDLSTAAKVLESYKSAESTDESYPENNDCSGSPAPDTICLPASQGTTYQYTYDAGSNTYALTATNGTTAYHITSSDQVPKEGAWSGHEGPGDDDEIAVHEYAMSANSYYGCAIYSPQGLYCWGSGLDGKLGDGSVSNNSAPGPVSTSGALSGKTIKKVVSGSDNTCVITTEQRLYCWGKASNNLLLNGSTTDAVFPVALNSGLISGKAITDVGVGPSFICAVTEGSAYCWGHGGQGSLGNGSTTTQSAPTAVSTSGALSGKTLTRIVGSKLNGHTCALDSDGKAYCWGTYGSGQTGDGNTSNAALHYSPVAVDTSGVLAGKVLIDIVAGGNHTCALDNQGAMYCWGSNGQGQLGDGTTTQRTTPVAVDTSGVLNGKKIQAIGAGQAHSCALAEGAVYCWGHNNYGEIGDNTLTQRTSPVAVDTSGALNGLTITDLAVGRFHTCARAGQPVYCWGDALNHALGYGSTTDRLVPQLIMNP